MDGIENDEKARQWEKDTETWMAYAASLHIPIDGTFELTARCNLSCKMCYVRLTRKQAEGIGREKTAQEWIDMGRQAFEAGCVYLLLTGGEPLLHPEFCEIYEALAQMGFIITVYTNATLVDEKVQKLFQKFPPMHIQVTLYGAGRDTYERLCGNPDAFDQTIAGLERLKTVNTRLGIRTTFVKDNAEDMEAIYELAMGYTKEYRMNPEVHKQFAEVDSDVEICRLSPREAVELEKRYVRFLLAKYREEEYNKDREGIYDSRPKKSGFGYEPEILECLAAKASYSISWDGKMYPCNTFSNLGTDPFREGFANAFRRLPQMLKGLSKPQKCLSCELGQQSACPNCPPKLYTETGSYTETCDYICEYARLRREAIHSKGDDTYEGKL